MSTSFLTGTYSRFYVVLPGAGRRPGIYTDWDSAEAQTKGFRNGRARKFASLALAESYWYDNVLDAEPEVFSVSGFTKAETRATLVYVGRDGLQLSRTIEGILAERVLRFMRHEQPPA